VSLQLGKNALRVVANGVELQTEKSRHLFVEQTLGHQLENLDFTRSQVGAEPSSGVTLVKEGQLAGPSSGAFQVLNMRSAGTFEIAGLVELRLQFVTVRDCPCEVGLAGDEILG
jgi:hypothetical protein